MKFRLIDLFKGRHKQEKSQQKTADTIVTKQQIPLKELNETPVRSQSASKGIRSCSRGASTTRKFRKSKQRRKNRMARRKRVYNANYHNR